MRSLKILIPALASAAALLAVAGTASADVLCKAAPNMAGECATSPGDYASGTAFTAEASPKLSFTDGGFFTSVTCDKSVLAWKSTGTGSNTSGSGVPFEITDLTFTGCHTNSGVACTVSTSSGDTGTLTATDDKGNADFLIKTGLDLVVSCPGLSTCTYQAGFQISLGLTAGNPAVLTASNEFLQFLNGFGCSGGVDWSGTYKFTGTNAAAWVATKMA